MEVSEAIKKYDPKRPYTYADYITWEDDPRCELIDGEVIVMEAPSIEHQRISKKLFRQLDLFLEGKKCEVFYAPIDVCLSGKGDDDTTVVQPDIVVICDHRILDEKRCNGAPDFVIEILSPSTKKYNKHQKMNKYMNAGVREYWIVDPDSETVAVHVFDRDNFFIGYYEYDESVPVHVLGGFEISLRDVFKRI